MNRLDRVARQRGASAKTPALLITAILLTSCCPRLALAQSTHPFSVHDMLAMDRIGDPNVAPDGRRIVFTLRTTDLEANKGRTDLWMIGADGSDLRRLTSDPASDANPRWSPDGKHVYFLSIRSGSSQVWRIPVDGGEAEQVTHEPLDVGNLVVSPDGEYLAFTMEVFPGASVEQTTKRLEEIANRQASGRLYDRLFIRHWDTWKDGRRSHVFVFPIGGGEAVDVMKDMDADSPSKPFGGTEEITFAPDGKTLVFVARDVGRKEAWSTDFDLYAVRLGADQPQKGERRAVASRPVCLTSDNETWDTAPAFSPDGRWLAYLAMRRPGYESDRFRIVIRSGNIDETPAQRPPAPPLRILTPDWDRSPGSIAWSPDGGTIYATATNLGQRSLFAIDVEAGKVRTVVHDGTIGGVAMAGERVVYGMDHLKSPVELYSIRSDGSDARRITHVNDEKLSAARMGDFQQFTFKGFNDETVYGYVGKPVDFDPEKKYPVAFLIHGGPQGSFGNHFHYRWNPQAYSGAGYAVVMVDFHGSTGYGQAFCDSIRGDWGGKPLEDLQKGLAAALERYPWMDGDRVAALGASFGGYMINWIAGNWPDRFRCLVSHDGNLDELSAYYNTEELWFPEWDHMGTPWENPEGYRKHNPVHYVKDWKTPMLVIHGARDYRVVATQGIAAFTALQRRGIPSKLLYFPDENHWVLKPHNSILWHDTVLAWLEQWTK